MRTHHQGESLDDRPTPAETGPWHDPSLPVPERVKTLLAAMSLEEKIAQLSAAWVGGDPEGDDVAPHQHALVDGGMDYEALIRDGLGQLTRPFGSAPVEPVEGVRTLTRMQRGVMAASRFGIPALVHEECLTGFMALGATIYPTPLAWGATFDPDLVERMAARVGRSMRDVGVHQGLAPVLDVVRDPRWGRTEETIGEDPYLVGTVGSAYVRGLQSAGIVATLKHFVGYSGSVAGRNHAPVPIGPRELSDVFLPPFEMAVRDAGAGSVMSAYTEIDGMPTTADPGILTDLLRGEWGFSGTVVSDYFGVSFLELLHGVAGTSTAAAGRALEAGVDVELPAVHCYGEPLVEAVRSGAVAEGLVDRAAARVLVQKCQLGLLDPGWNPLPGSSDGSSSAVELDPPESRALARTVAEESVVLLTNDGTLPLAPRTRLAVVGPLADDVAAMLGCYSFPSHVARHDTEAELAAAAPIATMLDALRAETPDAELTYAKGCEVSDPDTTGFAAATEVAAGADVCVAVVGDRAGLFGRGTSGEGCDAEDLRLPGAQEQLVRVLVDTGTPVVLVLMTGRPYALDGLADRAAATVQAFFPGEEGGAAVAGVLSGRVCPSGRLPVSVPRQPGGQPSTYLAPPLGQRSEVSSIDPTPLFPFGHGLSYTTFTWDDLQIGAEGEPVSEAGPIEVATDGSMTVSVRVRNAGNRAGAEVVQLYLHDPVAQVTRPVVRLIGYARVELDAGETRRIAFSVHAELAAFTGRNGTRVVEPGELELRLARSSLETSQVAKVTLVGPERTVDHTRRLMAEVTVT